MSKKKYIYLKYKIPLEKRIVTHAIIVIGLKSLNTFD